MRKVVMVLGSLLVLGGAVWILQGVNVLPGSFMTGDPRWAVRGLALAAAGILVLVLAARRGSGQDRPS